MLDPQLASSPDASVPTLGGTHYLGFLAQLTHNFSQQGAVTTGTLTFARPYNEGLEFFGTKDAKVQITKEVGPNAKLPGTYWAEVLGYVQMKKSVGGTTQSFSVPIVGMLGVKGRVGKHVNQGLKKQNKKLQIFWKKEGYFWNQAAAPGVQKGVETRSGSIAYEITPVVSASRSTRGASQRQDTTGQIREDYWADGYHYAPKLSWMSAGSLGAVEVEVRKKSRSNKQPKVIDYSFSFEQVARPPWIDKSYLNQNIGNDYYQQLLGCGALTDPTLVAELGIANYRSGNFDEGIDAAQAPPTAEQVTNIKKELEAVLKDPSEHLFEAGDGVYRKSTLEVKTADGQTFKLPAELVRGDSVKEATDSLASAYMNLVSETQSSVKDVDDFIGKFTGRKFATMVDIFGYGWQSGELMFDTDESATGRSGVVGTRYVMPFAEYDPDGMFTREQATAKEGFHSSAFGDVANLDLLPHDSLVDAYGGEARDINPEVDPRAERYGRVLTYRYNTAKTIQRG